MYKNSYSTNLGNMGNMGKQDVMYDLDSLSCM